MDERMIVVYPGGGTEEPMFEVLPLEESDALAGAGAYARFNRVGPDQAWVVNVRLSAWPMFEVQRFLEGFRAAKLGQAASTQPPRALMQALAEEAPRQGTPPCAMCGHVVQRHITRDGIPFCTVCPQPSGSEAHKHVYRPGRSD